MVIAVKLSPAAPPYAFFFLHVCTAWPVGVVGLALASNLVNAGLAVHDVAGIIAASNLAFTLEFLWAPLVDSSLTRRQWFVIGALLMAGCLVALLLVDPGIASLPMMIGLAFASSSGAAMAAVAVKGIMAYDVAGHRIAAASGYYTAGGTFAKAVGAAGVLWLLTHTTYRSSAAAFSLLVAGLAGTAIVHASAVPPFPGREVWTRLRTALRELWQLLCSRKGMVVAILCVIPFGAGTEAGLMGAIAREWTVSPDQLALFSTLGAACSMAGAMAAGRLAVRFGPWEVYLLMGRLMITCMLAMAVAPRTAAWFMAMELCYRMLSSGCFAALLGIVMTIIGQGAASTKAAGLWSLASLSVVYPTYIEGHIHDAMGTTAMLLADAGLGVLGFAALCLAARLLGLRLRAAVAPAC
jgi:MFS family permease